MSNGERVPYLLRMPPKLHQALKDLAGREQRSINGLVVFLLEQAIERPERAA